MSLGEIGCFLYADEASVNERTAKAVNDCHLVFDNGIIVDNIFRTKDPYM